MRNTILAQQALSAHVRRFVEESGLTPDAAFDALVSLAWSYARPAAVSNAAVVDRMHAAALSCEVARQHAVDVAERNGLVKS